MKYCKILFPAFAAIVMLSSCKSQFEAILDSNDSDAKYDAAFELFNKAKYQKAAQLFESLSVLTSGTERDDTVQYYWGLSNYRNKDYYTAETNFAKFLESFPRSPFAQDARFLRIDCLYRSTHRYELDQVPTYTAQAAISEYIHDDPNNPRAEACYQMLNDLDARLDRKAYENARLYYKMEDYKASRVAFKNVLKDDADNIYREDILYYTAMSSYKYAYHSVADKQKERYLSFIDDYYNFISEYPDSRYRKVLESSFRKAQKVLGRYTGDAEDENDKDLEKQIKDLEKNK